MFNFWRSLCKCVALINPKSIKNKALSLSDYIVTQDFDIFALTETWLGTSVGKKCIAELVPSGYRKKHVVEREVVWLCYTSLLYHSAVSAQVLGLAVMYRVPSPSKDNCSIIPDFLEQWSTFLVAYTTHNNEIVGDLNFHVDVKNDRDAQRFMDTIKVCGLQQDVHELNHVLGHTLDVVISSDTSHIISDVTITDPGLNDHLGKWHVTISLQMQKSVSYRKLRAIDVKAFKHDIVVSSMLQTTQGKVDSLVTAFTNWLSSLIFLLEPLQSILIVHVTPINYMKLNISDGS